MSMGPIMIMAGGTGGHVFPGLAVAEVLRRDRLDVIWLGTQRGLEARLVPAHGIDIEWVSIAGIRGRGLGAWLAAPFRILLAVLQVLGTLRRRRPAAVLGMGGFVSGPGGIAAWLCRKPLLIHEQNAVAGTTNRWLARLASQVLEAFPNSFPPRVRTKLVGNPVRESIAALPPPRERQLGAAGRPLRVLVLGGSQGAQALNRAVPRAVARLSEPPELLHQAGRGIDETRALYAELGMAVRLEEFIDDMAGAYAWADVVVARAGALTLAELSAAGVGAILVPYPYAIDDHQTKNASHFVAAGAGVLLPESELDAERLGRELERLMSDRAMVLRMAQSAREQARPDAAIEIARACSSLGRGAS